MKFNSQQASNAAKARLTPAPLADALTRDEIRLSSGQAPNAFLESALIMLSAQQPVCIPSQQEILDMQQQQSMVSMMAAIRHGEKQGIDDPPVQLPVPSQEHLLLTLNQIAHPEARRIPVQVEFDPEFVNLDSLGIAEGDRRVTLGVGSRAIFAKSSTSAEKLSVPVACFVASIKNGILSIVFHYASTGASSLNIELGSIENCLLGEEHIQLLTQKFHMHEQQARVFAMVIALQGAAYSTSLTSGLVQGLSDRFKVDYEGMLRLAVNIEKWRVLQTQPRISF